MLFRLQPKFYRPVCSMAYENGLFCSPLAQRNRRAKAPTWSAELKCSLCIGVQTRRVRLMRAARAQDNQSDITRMQSGCPDVSQSAVEPIRRVYSGHSLHFAFTMIFVCCMQSVTVIVVSLRCFFFDMPGFLLRGGKCGK